MGSSTFIMIYCLSDNQVSIISPKYLMEFDLEISQSVYLYRRYVTFVSGEKNSVLSGFIWSLSILIQFCRMSSCFFLNANTQAYSPSLLLGPKAAYWCWKTTINIITRSHFFLLHQYGGKIRCFIRHYCRLIVSYLRFFAEIG